MIYRTLEGVLQPDGKVTLAQATLPPRPVRVLVTILEDVEDQSLSEMGDYLQQLTDYDERLARGEIQWQYCAARSGGPTSPQAAARSRPACGPSSSSRTTAPTPPARTHPTTPWRSRPESVPGPRCLPIAGS